MARTTHFVKGIAWIEEIASYDYPFEVEVPDGSTYEEIKVLVEAAFINEENMNDYRKSLARKLTVMENATGG